MSSEGDTQGMPGTWLVLRSATRHSRANGQARDPLLQQSLAHEVEIPSLAFARPPCTVVSKRKTVTQPSAAVDDDDHKYVLL